MFVADYVDLGLFRNLFLKNEPVPGRNDYQRDVYHLQTQVREAQTQVIALEVRFRSAIAHGMLTNSECK
jgi:hypothetical protein